MKIFIALGSLIVVALLVLLVGPLFVDWTAYRSQFEAEASRLLGQHVKVRGEATARLLPFPSVTFGDVLIGDLDDPILSIRSFRMDAELAPYLSGEIRIFDMRLDAPRLSLPIEADGKVRWPVANSAIGDGTSVVLEHVAIADGSIALEDRRAGRRIDLKNLDAELSARSLAGPFSGTATLQADGEPLALALSTGQLAPDGGLPVRLTTTSPRADLAVSVDAVLSNQPDRPIVEGKVQFLTPAAPPTEAKDEAAARRQIQATGAIKLTTGEATLSDLRVEVGGTPQPYVIEGAASLAIGAIPHFDVTLRGQATDFDQLAPTAGEGGSTFQDRMASLRNLVARLPTSDIPGRVQLSLPLLTVGDTALRDVSFTGSPTADGWSIETFVAELPGRSRLEASGLATLRDHPSFKGSLLVAVRQPAAFFTWAGLGSAPELVSLTRAGLSAEIDMSADTQRLQALEIDLDGGTLTGSIQRTVRPEGTVNLVDLKGGRIDLRPLAAVVRSLPNASTIGTERFDVQFDAGPVTFGTYGAQNLAADFTLQDGMLDIADATAEDFAGASVHAEGTIADLFAAPRPDLGIDVLAEQPGRLLDLLSDLAPGSPLVRTLQARSNTLAPVTLAGTLASPAGEQARDLVLALSGTVGGTKTDLRLALENGLAAQWLNGRFGLDATFQNDDPTILLAQIGRPTIAVGQLAPLRISLNASGSPERPIAATVTATAGDTNISLNGELMLDATGISGVEARLRATSEDAAPWLTALGVAAGQSLERVPLHVDGRLGWSPLDWRIEQLEGSIAGDRVGATLQASGSTGMAGSVELSTLSVDWLQRVLLGQDQSDEGAPFGPWLLPQRAFSIDVAADRLTAGDVLLGSNLQLLLASDGAGLLRAGELSLASGGARLSGDAALRNVDGLVNLDGSAVLQDWTIKGQAILQGKADATIKLSGAGRTFREVTASLNGSGDLKLTDARLDGLSADVMIPVTLAADSQTGALDADTVARLVAETGTGASFPLGTQTIPLQVGAGVLRTAPFEAADGGAALEGEVAIGLSAGTVSGQLTLRPPTNETIEGTDPPRVDYRLGGTIKAPTLEARTEALTSYFGVRAFQREQARVDALREELSEAARLRREARFYRERATIRDEFMKARLEAEEAERRRKAQEEEDRRNAAQEAAQRQERQSIVPPTPAPDLSGPIVPAPAPPSLSGDLPGVTDLPRF